MQTEQSIRIGCNGVSTRVEYTRVSTGEECLRVSTRVGCLRVSTRVECLRVSTRVECLRVSTRVECLRVSTRVECLRVSTRKPTYSSVLPGYRKCSRIAPEFNWLYLTCCDASFPSHKSAAFTIGKRRRRMTDHLGNAT